MTVGVRLLGWLRRETGDPSLAFREGPRRLAGGTDTGTFRFALERSPPGWGAVLVLRVFPVAHGPARAEREAFVQKTLVDAGVPTAPARLVGADPVGGAPWFVMDHLDGELLVHLPRDRIPALLATGHAALHDREVAPVRVALERRGLEALNRGADLRLHRLRLRVRDRPWIGPAVDWLEANRPPPPRPVLCHGDFHPLNLLVRGGEITGILDWANFGIGDPMSDVACTLLLLTIYGRHVHDLPEADRFGAAYARAYAARRRLDRDRLDYHRVRHAVTTLVNGADGRSPWGRRAVRSDLVALIATVTEVRIEPPAGGTRSRAESFLSRSNVSPGGR